MATKNPNNIPMNGNSNLNNGLENDGEVNEEELENYELIGSPCGHHGPYTFYKAVKYLHGRDGRYRIISLGDFFFVKLWTNQDIISIGELQLLWQDKFNQQVLASLKLYFLPENTPDGRTDEHGEDEVVSISEKVVLKVSDLMTWIVDDVKWEKGSRSIWEKHCHPATPLAPCLNPLDHITNQNHSTSELQDPAGSLISLSSSCSSSEYNHHNEYHYYGPLDMRDVMKEKQLLGEESESLTCSVLVLSYPAYCRYRAALKRLEKCEAQYMRQAVVMALGGRPAPGPQTRVVFCKDTFDYPELEDHELLCNHLAPKWKGRPRKKRKKRSTSPGSESNESESSVSTVTSSTRSKDSPLKNGLQLPHSDNRSERPKGEQIFLQKLHKFMAGRGTPIGRLPSLGFKQLDLFLFYTKVQRAGGYEAAVTNKLWKGIYIELGGHPSNTSAATCTRRHYEKLLLPYERYSSRQQENVVTATPPKKRKLSDIQMDVKELNEPPPPPPVNRSRTTHDPVNGVEEKHPSKNGLKCELSCTNDIRNHESRKDEQRNDPRTDLRLTESRIPDVVRITEPRIVESCISQTDGSKRDTPPKIVESFLPVSTERPIKESVIVRYNDNRELKMIEEENRSIHKTNRPIIEDDDDDDDDNDSEPDVIVLSPSESDTPTPKITIRSDLTDNALTGEGLDVKPKIEEEISITTKENVKNLTLQELMTLGDPLALGNSNHSALNDLARIANQLQGHGSSFSSLKDGSKLLKGKASQSDSLTGVKEVKFHSGDSVQITVVNKHISESHPPSQTLPEIENIPSRPSVIQKNVENKPKPSEPLPAHSQKPVTSLNPAPELCQQYAQMLSENKSNPNLSSWAQSLLNDPAGLSLTFGINMPAPTPAAATPSIFVPSNRIYGDPSINVKKNRPTGLTVSQIPIAHTKTPNKIPALTPIVPVSHPSPVPNLVPASASVTPSHSRTSVVHSSSHNHSSFHPVHKPVQSTLPSVTVPPPPPPQLHPLPVGTGVVVAAAAPPPAQTVYPLPIPAQNSVPSSHSTSSYRPTPHHKDPIPLVDLTYRPIKTEDSLKKTPAPPLPPPPAAAAVPSSAEVNGKCLLDLSIKHQKSTANSTPATTIKVSPWSNTSPGNLTKSGGVLTLAGDVSISVNVKIEGGDGTKVANHSHAPATGTTPPNNRHSITVLPVVKEESQRHRSTKEKESNSRDRVSVTPMHHSPFPRMVDSLVSHSTNVTSTGSVSAPLTSSSRPSSNYSSHFSGAVSSSTNSHSLSGKISSTTTATTTTTSSSSAKSGPDPGINSVYTPFLDPALASYYSSLYAPHMYSLPSTTFLSGPPVFPPHLGSSAAEVTAQVYKDLVQRGYPPALAPGLPPLASLANLPGLNSLNSFTSMYSPLGSKEANASERSLPKS